MRKTATLLVVAGFGFAFITVWLPSMGIDLLIDAVGYLLVWNGLRALQARDKVYGFAPYVALALVGITTAQLMVRGTMIPVLSLVRPLAEALLFWQLFWGLRRIARAEQRRSLPGLYLATVVVGVLSCLLDIITALLFFTVWALELPAYFNAVTVVLLSVHIAMLLLLAYQAWLFSKDTPAGAKPAAQESKK